MPPKRQLITIGSTDKIDLPEFGLLDVPCKIDTGAYTSSIHCEKVKLVEKDGVEMITFKLLDKSHKEQTRQTFRFTDFQEKTIKSSFGDKEARFVIRTQVTLFGKTYKTWLSLSNRGEMRYPILLGKRFLRKKFLVDVSQKDLSYKLKYDSL